MKHYDTFGTEVKVKDSIVFLDDRSRRIIGTITRVDAYGNLMMRHLGWGYSTRIDYDFAKYNK